MDDPVWVRKLDVHGREQWRYRARVLRTTPHSWLLEAFFDLDTEICGTPIRRGDRSLEAFFSHRWYNLFAIYHQNSHALKGYYVNIGKPAFWTSAGLAYVDLALDVWVSPDGEMHVLDEEEFATLPLDAADRSQAKAALREVQRRFAAIKREAFGGL